MNKQISSSRSRFTDELVTNKLTQQTVPRKAFLIIWTDAKPVFLLVLFIVRKLGSELNSSTFQICTEDASPVEQYRDSFRERSREKY